MKSRILFRTTIQRLETNHKPEPEREDQKAKEPDLPKKEEEGEEPEPVIVEPALQDTGRIMFSSLMLSC